MARFTLKPLGLLDELYRFVGGLRSSSSVDIEAPVTLVHDVSREAEKGTGPFGFSFLQQVAQDKYFNFTFTVACVDNTVTTLGAGVYSNQSPSYLSTMVAPDPNTETVWVVAADLLIPDATGLTKAELWVQHANKASAGQGFNPWHPLAHWNSKGMSDGTVALAVGGGVQPAILPIGNKALNNQPLLALVQLSDALGGSVDISVLCLRLPNGVTPWA